MIVNSSAVNNTNNTLSNRRQSAAIEMLRRQKEVLALIPEIEDIDFEITSLGASYAMAFMAKKEDEAEEIKASMEALQEKKQHLLMVNDFSKDYLDDIYTCPICKDKGYINGRACKCMLAELTRQRQATLSSLSPAPNTSFDNFSLSYYSKAQNEDNVSPYEQLQGVLEYCKEFSRADLKGQKSILMIGTSGLGKTHLSCAIAKECMKRGYIVLYASSQILFSELEKNKYLTADNIVNDILSCDLFILDDLGTEYMTPYTLSILYSIVNSRMVKGLPCIYSTNLLTQKALLTKYGEKITSRLMGSCVPLRFFGKDIRYLLNEE